MIARCTKPEVIGYPNYGGRGVKVCERWLTSFDAFLEDVGPRPSRGHSLDRIDCDGNYEPGNVRWATREEQARNRRDNRMLTAFGRTQCATDWAAEAGVTVQTLLKRIDRGWDAERAIAAGARKQ